MTVERKKRKAYAARRHDRSLCTQQQQESVKCDCVPRQLIEYASLCWLFKLQVQYHCYTILHKQLEQDKRRKRHTAVGAHSWSLCMRTDADRKLEQREMLAASAD